MKLLYLFDLPPYILFLITFFLILLFNWLGYRYKKRQLDKHPGRVSEKMGSVEGSMIGVMGLLLGFTFSVALSKFETRRNQVIEEANNIGTTILRCDMYPDSVRSTLRADFKHYLESRIAYYRVGENEEQIASEIKKAEEISDRIWKTVAIHSKDPESRIRSQLMVPIMNDVIDIVTTRDASRLSRVPILILWTLIILVLTAAFILGTDYNGLKRNITLLLAYALVMSLTLNLINELNHPRKGFINLNVAEQKIEDLRKLF